MVEKHGPSDWRSHLFEPLRAAGARIQDFFSPDADAGATDDAYEVELELPGVEDDEIEITLHDNILSVKGEKRFHQEKAGKTYYFTERAYGAFHRSFRLPADVDAERIDARFSRGILTVQLPKIHAADDNVKRIKVSGD